MDFETIQKFIEAGYTKADIDAMQGGNTEGSNTEEGTETGTENTSKTLMDTEPDISEKPEVNADIKALSDTVAELSKTIKAMQEKNAGTADGGRPTDKIKEVMDSFIKEL